MKRNKDDGTRQPTRRYSHSLRPATMIHVLKIERNHDRRHDRRKRLDSSFFRGSSRGVFGVLNHLKIICKIIIWNSEIRKKPHFKI